MATAAPPGKSVHLYRLLTLTIDQGNIVVRYIFDQAIGNIPLHQFLTQEKKDIKRLRAKNIITKVQYDKLFPQAGNPPPTTADFDLTLAVCLLRNLKSCGLNPNFNWSASPQLGDTSREADIRRLQMFRNDLAHISATSGLNQMKFNQKWIDTVQVLNRLNGSLRLPIPNLQQDIDDCKTKHLDPEAQERIEKHIESMQSSLGDLENKVQDLQEDVTSISKRLNVLEEQKKSEETKDSTTFKPPKSKQDDYQEMKEQLKNDLAEFHRNRHSTIPLSPLFEEKDTSLLDFYLMPGMNVIKMVDGKEEKTAIQSLSEVYKSSDEYSKEIYVTADAGFGKTTFSKYLTILWCQAHFPDEKHTKHLPEESVNAMRDFEFLFLVLLRESADDCSIDDLIFNHVVRTFSRSKSYSEQTLQQILHRERCLVVLDGLDEWTHPNKKCREESRDIPHRNYHKSCTYMTTTRPWKLSTLQLGTRKLDKQIELTNLDYESALELTTRALKKLKGKTDLEMREEAERLLDRYHDFEQVSVPLLLMYVICLWCDNVPLGQTKFDIYTSIIELLLSRTVNKFNKKSQAEILQRVKNTKQCSAIPKCFSDQEHCKAYFTFLASLGELAFQTLFSENRLVFDSSIAEKCLKEDFLELGRLTGIITQDKQTTYAQQIRKTSFSHKTVQEFFAAIYISICSEQDKVLPKVLSLCNSIQDILDLSKVFIFISGSNAQLFSSLPIKLMEVINKDKITSRYRSTADPVYRHPLIEIQNMFVSCITEISDKTIATICLQDFFFDEKCRQENYFKSLQRLAVNNKSNIKSIYIDDTVGQSSSEIIYSCELSDLKNCHKIYCVGCKEEEIIRLLSTSVKCLDIFGIQSDDERKGDLSCLTDEQCKIFHNSSKLETIDIKWCTVNHKFLNYIINVNSIKQIRLQHLSCRDHVFSCPGFTFDLSQHSELRKLELWECNFTLFDTNEDEILLLHNMRNIKYVRLYRVKMSSLLLHRLVEILKNLEHKVKVELLHCKMKPWAEFINIREDICISESFVVENDVRDDSGWRFQFVSKK